MKHPPGRQATEDPSALIDSAAELGIDLIGNQADALLLFELLLLDKAIPLGFVAEGDRTTIRERHILDSLRAVLALEGSDTNALDLGSGAGLPGIVVAIARPSLRVGLVEARGRRAAFPELAVERLGLPNAVVLARPAGRLEGVRRCLVVPPAPYTCTCKLRAARYHDPAVTACGTSTSGE